MAEFQNTLSTPWRMSYIRQLSDGGDDTGCFLCRYRDAPGDDGRNRVLWRSERTLVVLNLFPYTSGHLLVAPAEHRADYDALPAGVLDELSRRLRDAVRVLREAVKPHGFNIGMNLGRCAGAGLPEHLHWHVVPRWNGDTNFVSVVGDVRVIPLPIDEVYAALRACAAALHLPAEVES